MGGDRSWLLRWQSVSLFRNPPSTLYADTGDGLVGYQTFGDGPLKVVFAPGIDSNIEIVWERREFSQFFDRLASFATVVFYDSRGQGISDSVPERRFGTYETWIDDTATVMDAVGFESAVVIGDRETGPTTIRFAATYPDRVSGLVLLNTYARFARDDDYPIGAPFAAVRALVERVAPLWGKPGFYVGASPSLEGQTDLNDWLARLQRLSLSPSVAGLISERFEQADVRSVLASVQAPTLVIARSDAQFHRPEFGQYLADQIPDSEFVLLPGADTSPFWVGDTEPVLDEIERFVAGHHKPPSTNRVFATVLFTDIVDSTTTAATLGDDLWLDLVEDHYRIAERTVDRFDGRIVKRTGDGVLAVFDGPSRAVLCAIELEQALARIGISTRSGIHAGEIEVAPDGDVGGVAVNIASRVMDEVEGSGIAMSRTVKELTAGSTFTTEPLGTRTLKGLPEPWEIHKIG
jgi:class 3 adenylate cyclase/pimeloyl-ACP methyl ester carboxylesterase